VARAAATALTLLALEGLGASTATAHERNETTNRTCWVCWDRVAQCESTSRWHINTGNGFTGGLQFLRSTWIATGGLRYAYDAYLASRVQQIRIAERLRRKQGLRPWPVCGRRYYG
jgi:hypothetical protein